MLIVLSSVTGAQRLKKLLAAGNIRAEIIQTPKSISDGGCSYSLRLSDSHLQDVLSLTSALHISVKKIHHENQ